MSHRTPVLELSRAIRDRVHAAVTAGFRDDKLLLQIVGADPGSAKLRKEQQYWARCMSVLNYADDLIDEIESKRIAAARNKQQEKRRRRAIRANVEPRPAAAVSDVAELMIADDTLLYQQDGSC